MSLLALPFLLIARSDDRLDGRVEYWALVDCIQVPDDTMYRSGTKLIWVLVIVFATLIGAIVYLAIGRPDATSVAMARPRRPARHRRRPEMAEFSIDRFVDRYAARTSGMSASEVRALFAVASRPEVISFAGGMPFVRGDTRARRSTAVADEVLREHGATALQYGGGRDSWDCANAWRC